VERKTRLWIGCAATVLFTALTLVYLRPVASVWQDHIAPVPEDSVFNLWVLKWGAHQIRLGLPDFWNANIFYPTRGALTFSDHLIGPAFQLALFELVIPNAVAGYNFLFVTSFIASALATAWVARKSGASVLAALLAGWAFAFSPFRLQHLNHIQLLIAQWLPLTLWHWDRLLAERTPGNAVRFALLYLLHVTGGCYLAYMIHIPMLVLLANRAGGPGGVHGRELVSRRSLCVLLPVAVFCGLLLAALFVPYLETSKRLGFTRDPNEIGVLGAALPSYLSPALENGYFDPPPRSFWRTAAGDWARPFFRSENALFAGFLPTVLGIVGLAGWLRRRRAPAESGRWLRTTLLLVALLAWIWGDLLTLTPMEDRADLPWRLGAWGWNGPAILLAVSLGLRLVLRRRRGGPLLPMAEVWWRGIALSGLACFALTFPIVYLPSARIVPGLDGMRSPARFYAFVSLTVALFAARGADLLLARLRTAGARRIVGAALVAVLAIELAPEPVRWLPILREEQFPPVYSWIARQPDVRALVELPIRRNWRENVAMYYSTLHWRPIANGYSGYEPPSHISIAERIRYVPDPAGVALLRSLGITHILIHVDELGRRRRPGLQRLEEFEKSLASGPHREVEPVYQDSDIRVYRIVPSPRRPVAPDRTDRSDPTDRSDRARPAGGGRGNRGSGA
jgi:hypothetical protein